MIDYDVLASVGTTNKRWQEICTAQSPKDYADLPEERQKEIDRDIDIRRKIENELRDKINECISWGLQNYMIYGAADLAWDSAPINKQIYPLMLYAQGKINV